MPEGGNQTSWQTKESRENFFLAEFGSTKPWAHEPDPAEPSARLLSFPGVHRIGNCISILCFQPFSSTGRYFLFVGIMGALIQSFRAFSVENANPLVHLKTGDVDTSDGCDLSRRRAEVKNRSPVPYFPPHGSTGRIKALYSLVQDNHTQKTGRVSALRREVFCTKPQSHLQNRHPKIPAAFNRDFQVFPVPLHRFTPRVHRAHWVWNKTSELTPPGFPEEKIPFPRAPCAKHLQVFLV